MTAWLVLALLLVISAFFSAAETAIISVGRLKARVLDEQQRSGARVLRDLLADPNRLLTTILVGNNAANVAASAIATAAAIRYLGATGTGVAAVGMTVIILVLGEIMPKSYAAHYAERVALALAGPVRLAGVLLAVPVQAFTWLSRVSLRLFGVSGQRGVVVTEDEIRSLISIGHEQGVVDQAEEEILHSVFEFTDTAASEVMTPRHDMPAVPAAAAVDEAAGHLLQQGVTRLAVYEGTTDNVVGVVHMEDVLKAKVEGAPLVVAELLRPALVVPETKPVGDLFERMRKDRVSAALVADEYGTVAGMITLEDMVEHIVGDLWDEHDPAEDDWIKPLDAQSSIIDGRLSVDETNDALAVGLPTDKAHTVGGWIFHRLGRLPKVGDAVESQGVEFRVEAMDGWRVDRVRVKKLGAGARQGGG